MGGLLPEECLYYSEHTVAPGQLFSRWIKPQTLQHWETLATQQHFIFLCTSAAHAGKAWWPLHMMTQTLSHSHLQEEHSCEVVLHPWPGCNPHVSVFLPPGPQGLWFSTWLKVAGKKNAWLFWTFDKKRSDKNVAKNWMYQQLSATAMYLSAADKCVFVGGSGIPYVIGDKMRKKVINHTISCFLQFIQYKRYYVYGISP